MPASSADSFLKALALVTTCFRRQSVPYVVIGAWALAVWGKPRATQDLDFMVTVKSTAALGGVVNALTRAGMAVDHAWQHDNPLLSDSQVRLHRKAIIIDLLAPQDAHDHRLFKRRLKKRLGNRYFWFVSPEDFILQKLKVGRPKDFEDAIAVLERSGKAMDRRYLERWARRLRVSGELNYILNL